MDRNSIWMAISGLAGLSFFLIANFLDLFAGSSVLAGCLQLCANAFVFIVWTRAFTHSHGFKKFIACFGVVVPIIMTSITLWRVLIPAALG